MCLGAVRQQHDLSYVVPFVAGCEDDSSVPGLSKVIGVIPGQVAHSDDVAGASVKPDQQVGSNCVQRDVHSAASPA